MTKLKLMKHRRFRSGFTLCGEKATIKNSTLNDDEVNCKICLSILDRSKYVDTNTETLKKIVNENNT